MMMGIFVGQVHNHITITNALWCVRSLAKQKSVSSAYFTIWLWIGYVTVKTNSMWMHDDDAKWERETERKRKRKWIALHRNRTMCAVRDLHLIKELGEYSSIQYFIMYILCVCFFSLHFFPAFMTLFSLLSWWNREKSFEFNRQSFVQDPKLSQTCMNQVFSNI